MSLPTGHNSSLNDVRGWVSLTSRRHPAYVMPFRATLPRHRPRRDSCETESLYVSVAPPFRKAPWLGPTSVPHAPSTIQETKCSKGYACRFRTHVAVSLGPFLGIRSLSSSAPSLNSTLGSGS